MNKIETGGKTHSLIILCGAPASGKSTWGTKFARENNVVYVSTDEIRAEIGSSESDQSVSPAAFGIAKQRVSQSLSQGKHAMIDATSVNKKARKDWINMGRGHGAYVIAVAFEVSTPELYRRDAQRPRHVGKEVIDRFVGKYQRPDTTEVDKVIVK
jgi:predicted kinase